MLDILKYFYFSRYNTTFTRKILKLSEHLSYIMHFFRSVKKSKVFKANLRKKLLPGRFCQNEIIQDNSDVSSESGDDESQYYPSSESEQDEQDQECFDPNNVIIITNFLVKEGLCKFATSVSGGSKSEAVAMLWVKRTAQILDYTYYEVNKKSLLQMNMMKMILY